MVVMVLLVIIVNVVVVLAAMNTSVVVQVPIEIHRTLILALHPMFPASLQPVLHWIFSTTFLIRISVKQRSFQAHCGFARFPPCQLQPKHAFF